MGVSQTSLFLTSLTEEAKAAATGHVPRLEATARPLSRLRHQAQDPRRHGGRVGHPFTATFGQGLYGKALLGPQAVLSHLSSPWTASINIPLTVNRGKQTKTKNKATLHGAGND